MRSSSLPPRVQVPLQRQEPIPRFTQLTPFLLPDSVTPAEGELFKRFSPELQKRNLELRDERMKNHQDFVAQLKEYSKSDKPIWVAAAEAQAKAREDALRSQTEQQIAQEKIRLEMRAQAQGR